MGIFGRNRNIQAGPMPIVTKDGKTCSNTAVWTMCDRCHLARAKVEVVTKAGSIFLCQHHHREHCGSIIAAGHQILLTVCD